MFERDGSFHLLELVQSTPMAASPPSSTDWPSPSINLERSWLFHHTLLIHNLVLREQENWPNILYFADSWNGICCYFTSSKYWLESDLLLFQLLPACDPYMFGKCSSVSAAHQVFSLKATGQTGTRREKISPEEHFFRKNMFLLWFPELIRVQRQGIGNIWNLSTTPKIFTVPKYIFQTSDLPKILKFTLK